MSEYNQERLTQDVVAAFAGTPDPRLRLVAMTSLVIAHPRLRARGRPDARGMAGRSAVPERDRPDLDREAPRVHPALRHARPVDDGRLAGRRRAPAATPRARPRPPRRPSKGPFYWPGAPDLALGTDIGEGVPGEPTFYMGRVTDFDGKPLAGALLDVWSGDGDGKYDVQLSTSRR